MHIQLADFATACINEPSSASKNDESECQNGEKKAAQRKNSFVGTAQFVAPEILQCGPVHSGFV